MRHRVQRETGIEQVSPSGQPHPHGQTAGLPLCPRCGSIDTIGHGTFRLRDGSRRPRRLCRGCGRSFNPNTGTPLNYLKKPAEWNLMLKTMPRGLSVRKTATTIGVQVATAFDWRHRLLGVWAARPQPVLSESVAATEAFIPYSEKGRRHPRGAAATKAFAPNSAQMRRHDHGVAVLGGSSATFLTVVGQRKFRRLVDARPSCVLLAADRDRSATVITGQGRPSPEDLSKSLAPLLGSGTELVAIGLAPYTAACRQMEVHHRNPWSPDAAPTHRQLFRGVERLCRHLYTWLRKFRGVATRYLQHYLAWHRLSFQQVLQTWSSPGA